LELLEAVQIRSPPRCNRQYPHELSGGCANALLIAMAFACKPQLIIADEPTTALDVTVQREVLRLLRSCSATKGRRAVHHSQSGAGGQAVRQRQRDPFGTHHRHGDVRRIIEAPRTDYTRALFRRHAALRPPAEALRRSMRR